MAQQQGLRRSSLSWAVESSYGSLSATTGLPDPSGLSYTAAEVTAFDAYEGQEEPGIARNVARTQPGSYPDEPLTVYSSGSPVQRRSGEMTIRFNGLRCPVSGAAVSTLFLARLLRTVCHFSAQSAGDQDTVAAGSWSVNSAEVATVAEFGVGRYFAKTNNGRIEFARVTDITGSALTWSPALSAIPAGSDVLRHCETYSPRLGALDGTDNPSLALRFDLHGRRFYATGCRLRSLTIDVGADGIARPTARVMLGWVQDDDGAASPATLGSQGVYAQRGQSYDVYGSLAAVTSPADASRTVIAARQWSFTLDWTLALEGRADNGMGHGDMIVADVTAKLTMSITPDGTLEAMRRAGTQAMVLCGLGPTSAGNAGRQMGFGLALNGAKFDSYAKPAPGEAETTVELSLSDGIYALDTGSWSNGAHIDAPWSLFWVS